jgi:DNA-binding SARP family transcriptional activator
VIRAGPSLTLQLLGGVSLRDADVPLAGPAAQRHRLALLALAAAAHPAPVSRDRLVALLWPERDEPSARRLLAVAVHALRRALGAGAVRSVGGGLALGPVLRVDLLDFERALAAGDLDAATRAYGGPFLDGFHLAGSVEFAQWADGERDRLRARQAAALAALADARAERGDAAGASEASRRLSALDPLDGAAALRLVEALAAAGDRAGALREAAAYAARLREACGLEPDAPLRALVERLRRGELAPAPARDAGGGASGASGASAARAALDGLVRLGGGWVRVEVRLLGEGAAAPHAAPAAGTEPFDDAQDGDLEAAALLCERGRYFWSRRGADDLRKALACFERAAALVPAHAPAHAGIADGCAVLGFYDHLPPGEAFARARAAAGRALELAPLAAEPHLSLAYIRMYHDFEWPLAERSFRRAIELDPRHPVAHQWYGNFLALRGRFDEAVREMERSRALAPLSPIAHAALGWACFHAGRYARTIDHCLEAAELDPHFGVAQLWLGQAYEQQGRLADAIDALGRASALAPANLAMAAAASRVRALAGERDGASELLERAATAPPDAYVPAYDVAKLHLALGDTGSALEWLAQAHRQRSHSVAFLRVDPELAPLRGEARYRELVGAVGLG